MTIEFLLELRDEVICDNSISTTDCMITVGVINDKIKELRKKECEKKGV